MRETREIEFKEKVFTKQDIRNIWSLFNDQPKPTDQYAPPLTIQVRCDGIRYESEDDDFLKDGNIVDLKKIESIAFDYHDYNNQKSIRASLRHGSNSYGNEFSVSGPDRDWVAGIFSRFEEILAAVQPQQSWFLQNKNLLMFLFSLVLALVIFELGYYLTEVHNGSHDSILRLLTAYPVSSFIVFLGCFLPGLFISFSSISWFMELWPSIEFGFGPEHLQLEKSRRKRIWLFISLIVLPFLISLAPLFFPNHN